MLAHWTADRGDVGHLLAAIWMLFLEIWKIKSVKEKCLRSLLYKWGFLCPGRLVKAVTHYGISALCVKSQILHANGTVLQVRLRLSWLKYSQSFSTQLPFIHDLATVFGVWRHSLPLHSQIQPQETGHDTLASCASWTTGKGLDDLGSQWAPDVVGDTNVQGKLCSVALHHTLEISKQLPHVISETHGSLSSSWPDNISRERRKMNNASQHFHPKIRSANPVIFNLHRHKH